MKDKKPKTQCSRYHEQPFNNPSEVAGSANQQCGVFHVLVARVLLCVVWPDMPAFTFQIVLAPLVTAATSAESVWATIFLHPLNAPIFQALKLLLQASTYAFNVLESDAAMSNERLVAYLFMTSTSISMWNPCGNHQTNLAEASVLVSSGYALLSKLYSIALFLRTENHFNRMVLAVPRLVANNLAIMKTRLHGEPPALATKFNKEAMKYLTCHYRRFATSQREDGRASGSSASESEGDFLRPGSRQPRDRGLRNMIDAAKDFLRNINGRWWRAAIEHWCRL